jgi:hypothetical protein
MKIGEVSSKITARVRGTFEQLVPKGISPIGTLYSQELKFLAGSYTLPSGQVFDYGELKLNACMLSYSMKNIIVRTQVNNLNGTIKEAIASDDVIIYVKGNLTAGIGLLYPEDKVIALTDLYEAKKTLQIKNVFLNSKLNVNSVVIESLDMSDPVDFSVIPFSMTLYSDFDDIDSFENFVIK